MVLRFLTDYENTWEVTTGRKNIRNIEVKSHSKHDLGLFSVPDGVSGSIYCRPSLDGGPNININFSIDTNIPKLYLPFIQKQYPNLSHRGRR